MNPTETQPVTPPVTAPAPAKAPVVAPTPPTPSVSTPGQKGPSSYTTSSFANSIRQKFPTGVTSDGKKYGDMSDQDLVGRIVQKYPVYKTQITDLSGEDSTLAPVEPAQPEKQGLFDRIGADFKEGKDKTQEVLKSDQSGASKVLQTAGNAAAFVGDIPTEAAKSLDETVTGGKVGDFLKSLVEKATGTPVGQETMSALDKFSQDHPEASKNLGAILNLASVVPEVGLAGKGAKVASDVAKTGLKATEGVTREAKTINAIARAGKETKTSNEIAGQIVQGKKIDIEKAKQALGSIETKGVKTYADLHGALDAKIKSLSSGLDTAFGTDKTKRLLPDLGHTTKVGDQEVKHNYVEDAIKQLQDHYKATNDVEGLTKINAFESSAKSEGITTKQINDLAREHGNVLNAFNANGQAASGLIKQAAENTRTGLKATARNLFGNEVAGQVDKHVASLIHTRDLVSKVEEEVNKWSQKIKTRTLGEKAGRLVGKFMNTIGMNTPKGLIEYFLGRGTGLKTLNPIDIQEALKKNLSSLQKVNASGSEEDMLQSLQDIIKQRSVSGGKDK